MEPTKIQQKPNNTITKNEVNSTPTTPKTLWKFHQLLDPVLLLWAQVWCHFGFGIPSENVYLTTSGRVERGKEGVVFPETIAFHITRAIAPIMAEIAIVVENTVRGMLLQKRMFEEKLTYIIKRVMTTVQTSPRNCRMKWANVMPAVI